ncbi:unnamed protein product [Rotaria sp. Silwood2]|nr:unnamed protein product [Rotaria sp. Silwood2]CAF4327200.1 unnamed protein product [Rotaria sp. Silwood2]
MSQGDASRTTYERFLEFERLMKAPGSSRAQPYKAAPIGFCAFALTLFVYSMYMAGATVPISTTPTITMGLVLFYGSLIQFLAGLFELRVGNNFNGLVFCSYSGYWFGLGAIYASTFGYLTSVTDTTTQYNALGVFYLAWLIFTLIMIFASIRTNIINVAFFSVLALTYMLLTASYFLTWHHNLSRAGGAFGIVTAAIGWYAGFANLLKKDDNSYLDFPMVDLSPKSKADSV